MKYWTLFTFRMLARAGLIVVLILWIAGWWGGFSHCAVLRDGIATIVADGNAMVIGWGPRIHEFGSIRIFQTVSGTRAVYVESDMVQIHFWFLCLIFLSTTIVTSVKWRKKPADER